MEKVIYQHYVLFPNHDNGLRLHKALKELGVRATIAPTPRSLSKCCGISLMVLEEDVDRIKDCVEKNQIDILGIEKIRKDINPNRDRYC